MNSQIERYLGWQNGERKASVPVESGYPPVHRYVHNLGAPTTSLFRGFLWGFLLRREWLNHRPCDCTQSPWRSQSPAESSSSLIIWLLSWWPASSLKLSQGPAWSHLISIIETLLFLREFQGVLNSMPGTGDKNFFIFTFTFIFILHMFIYLLHI